MQSNAVSDGKSRRVPSATSLEPCLIARFDDIAVELDYRCDVARRPSGDPLPLPGPPWCGGRYSQVSRQREASTRHLPRQSWYALYLLPSVGSVPHWLLLHAC